MYFIIWWENSVIILINKRIKSFYIDLNFSSNEKHFLLLKLCTGTYKILEQKIPNYSKLMFRFNYNNLFNNALWEKENFNNLNKFHENFCKKYLSQKNSNFFQIKSLFSFKNEIILVSNKANRYLVIDIFITYIRKTIK